MWLVIHQNDHDDAEDHYNILGAFTNEPDAYRLIADREKSIDTTSKQNEDVQRFWFGNDQYWIVRLW